MQDIKPFLPHRDAMCLLHRLVKVEDESLVAEADIRDDNIFLSPTGIGAWVGIEYMAQAVAAWSGYYACQKGLEPQIGYLLGTRAYHCDRSNFNLGECLRISVTRDMQMANGLSRFDCVIEINGSAVANAALNLYQSPDSSADIPNS